MDREDVLKRVLDFKLVYDCLAEPKSGLVCLDVLLSSWPSLNTLPRDLEKFWRQSANSEGYLDWEGFSGGLKKALVAADEQFRKGRVTSSTYKQSTACKPTTRKPLPQVTSGELERFLSSCHNDSLVKALAKAGKDVHRWQVSIHKQNSIPAGKKGEYILLQPSYVLFKHDCSLGQTLLKRADMKRVKSSIVPVSLLEERGRS